MAEHSGNWYPVGPVLWDAQGPYRATSDGLKAYIPPIAAAQYQDDPKLLAWAKSQGANVTYGQKDANGNPTVSDVRTGSPGSSFMHGNPYWDSESGGYKDPNFFDTPFGSLVLGAGAVAAPFAASALTGAAASPATSIPAAFGETAVDTLASAAPATAAAGGSAALLPSTQIGNGMIAAAPSSTSSLAAPAAGLPDWLKTAQNVGDALSSASAGRAQGRLAEGVANQNQNRAAVDLYNTELSAPRTIARNAVKGDVLANAQDVHIDHPSTIPDFNITGGLRPSMFSDATRQTGRNISTAAANTPIPSPTAPILPELPQAGGLDSFLNTASTISGLSRAIPPDYWGTIGKGLKGLFA